MSSNNQSFYSFREFRLDVAERKLLRANESVPLMPKVFDVLAVLVERSGHLVEKDELLRIVWEDAFVEESNVARVVHALRKTLGEDAEHKFIETIPKRGYRFVAEVEKTNGHAPAETAAAAETYTPTRESSVNYVLGTGDDLVRVNGRNAPRRADFFDANGSENAAPPTAGGNQSSRVFWLAAGFLMIAFLVTGIFLYKNSPTPTASTAQAKSIAVLPLKPINNQNRDAIYELGIAESLILKLSSGKEMIVRPLSATRRYLGLEQNPTDAGREQKVDFVLESNYQIANGKIRVTSRLINTQTGSVEEVFKSERDSANVFLMQDAVANDIGNTLLARFGSHQSGSMAKRGTSNEEAYRLYLQAAFIFDQWNKSEVGKAVEYLERAVKLDPDYAQAYVMLAYAHRFFMHKSRTPQEQTQKSKAAIEKALALDPDLSEAHAVLGLLKFSSETDFAGARAEYRRAIELDPDSPMAHALYAYFLMSQGEFDEAVAENKKAIEIDPASNAHQITYGMILYYAHRYGEATAHYKRILEKDRDFVYPYFWLWLLCDLQGDEAQAFEWFMQYQTQIKADPELINGYRAAYQKGGWKGILREVIAQDEKRLQTDEYPGLFYEIACFSARLGEREKAFENLEKARRASSTSMNFLKVDPYLDTLHDDPRFEKFTRRVKSN